MLNNEMLNEVYENGIDPQEAMDLAQLEDLVNFEDIEKPNEEIIEELFEKAGMDGAKLALLIAGGALAAYGTYKIYNKFVKKHVDKKVEKLIAKYSDFRAKQIQKGMEETLEDLCDDNDDIID